MDGNKIPGDPSVICTDANKLTEVAKPLADSLMEVLKLLPTPIPMDSKLHTSLEVIRSVPLESSSKDYADAAIEILNSQIPDVQVDVKPEEVENQMNSKKANEWLEMAITALSVNYYQEAGQYLEKFNDLCPTDQVKMILIKIYDKIPKRVPLDPDTFMVTRFIDIAKKAVMAKDFSKAQELLNKAESIKPTPEAQNILKNINQTLQNHQTETLEKLVEYALIAIEEDDYDIAEILAKASWIQYKNKPAKKLLDMFFGKPRLNKNIECKVNNLTTHLLSDNYLRKAKKLISEGQIKAAESILIIAHLTYTSLSSFSDHFVVMTNENSPFLALVNIQKLLYPTASPADYRSTSEWTLREYFDGGKRHRHLDPKTNVATFKSYYFITMAFRAFKYAADAKLALEFLKEADTIYPNCKDIKTFIEEVTKRVQ